MTHINANDEKLHNNKPESSKAPEFIKAKSNTTIELIYTEPKDLKKATNESKLTNESLPTNIILKL